MPVNLHEFTMLDVPILEIWDDDVALAERYRLAFEMDKSYRDGIVDFDKIDCIYGRRSNDTNDDGIPHINVIRPMIHGFLGALLPNMPGAQLVSTKVIDPNLPDIERHIRIKLLKESEDHFNSLVQSMMFEDGYEAKRNMAVEQAAIFGVGYIFVEPDYDLDPRTSEEAREIIEMIESGEYDQEEVEAAIHNSAQVNIRWADTRDVYLEYGRRKIDRNMTRCCQVEYVDRASIREHVDEEVVEMIGSGHSLADAEVFDEISEATSPSIPVITFWELEPIQYKVGSVEVNDWFLVKVKMSGSGIVKKEIFTRTGGTVSAGGYSAETKRGAVRLPVNGFYVYEDTSHPYGYSIVLQQELHEEAYNRQIATMMRFADRQLEATKLIYMRSALGASDKANIEYGLQDPNTRAIEIVGNELDQDPDIRKVVTTVANTVPQIPPMMLSFTNFLLRQLQMTGAIEDTAAVARARSGSGKRTQVASSDRPKILSVDNISRGVQNVHQAVADNVRYMYANRSSDRVLVTPGGQRSSVTFNEEVEQLIPLLNQNDEPIFDSSFISKNNPLGEVPPYPATFVINDTNLPMRAVVDGSAEFSSDMFERLTQTATLQELGYIVPETGREVILSRRLRHLDDANRAEAQQQAQPTDFNQVRSQLNNAGMSGQNDLFSSAENMAQGAPDLLTLPA